MKKAKILAAVVVLAMVASISSGCKSAQTTAEDKGMANENKDITLIRPGLDPNNMKMGDNIGISKYNKMYNAKVKVITCTYDNWTTLLTSSIQAGKPIDICYGSISSYPLQYMLNLTEPLDNYVDLKADYLSPQAMQQCYQFGGHYYNAVSTRNISPCVMYYNKDMFENAGVADPKTLVDSNQWDWDHFKQLCVQFTDKSKKTAGLTAWYPNVFFSANYTSCLKWGNDKFSSNLDDPNLKTALEYLQDMFYTSQWEHTYGDNLTQSFEGGHNAFMNEYSWVETQLIQDKKNGKFSFSYGILPIPYGPNNKKHYNVAFTDGYGITNGCKNPYHAGKLIEMIAQSTVEQDKTLDQYRVDNDMLQKLRENPYSSTYNDSAIDGGNQLADVTDGGGNIDTAIKKFKSVAQGYIDSYNAQFVSNTASTAKK